MIESWMGLLFLLAVAGLSMVVYAGMGRERDQDADRRGSQFVGGLGDFVVHWFMWVLSPFDRVFLWLGLSPDFFNFTGLAFGALSGLFIASGHLELGGWAIALGGVADIFDGRIARARNIASEYGKFIDSTFDRFVEVFAFLGFVYYLRGFTYGPLVACAAISGSLLVSYTRARGESVGVLCKEGFMQRAERLVLTCLACLTDHALTEAGGWPPGTVVLWMVALVAVGTFITAAHRTVWIAQKLRDPGPR
jgi:CDP-diacylglycerol---glycerol-3-phosphate 3-phosphatidyltransferase